MFLIPRKQVTLFVILFASAFSVLSQKPDNAIKPFSGSKPFKKFSVGINAGVLKSSIIAGGSNDYTKNLLNFGYGLNLKYQLTHALALQADFIGGKLSGNQDKVQGTDSLNLSKPYTSFKTNLHVAGSLSAVYTFSNINWMNLKNWMVPYVGIGAGLANWDVKVVPKGSTTPVYYPYGKKKNITELIMPVSMGVRFKLTNMMNLDLGYTMYFVDGDNLDGFAYWRVPTGFSSTTKKDKFSYTHLGIEFAFGKKSKPQLMYDNPVARLHNNLQTQINNLSNKVDSLAAKQKGLDDFDGDGVADLFDKEPNTPAGCPVDAQGVMRDTDGDGVVDCKDKQLITPTECQPVDADGVGKCPDPECCKNVGTSGDNDTNKPIVAYPSLDFKNNSPALGNDEKAAIATIAEKMKASPDSRIIIKGHPETSKSSQALCQKRVEAIKKRLIEKEGISADRITTICEIGSGEKNTVEIITN
ncbi:hypothetical protein BH11BAC4_BH11BAC4_20090 [soil metagenome]